MATPAPTLDLVDDLVDRLLASYETGPRAMSHLGAYELPQTAEVVRCLDEVRALLFPGFVGPPVGGDLRAHVGAALARLAPRLRAQIYRGLHHRCRLLGGGVSVSDEECKSCDDAAEAIARRFVGELPDLRAVLASDVQAAYDGDPAAHGTDEVIICYPGLYAIAAFRVANRLHRAGASIIPRMITEHAHERTGIDIHPGATIAGSFFIDHGTGIVVGETTVIGERVRIYQGVTLGALSVPKSKVRALETAKRHPTIEDDVIIYANATILGGDTVIGRGAVVGGNCWVTRSVAPGARVLVDGANTGAI
jgi:serine O-acetyltransferase